MKRFGLMAAAVAVAACVGCGDADLNKDMKPVDKDTPKPQGAGVTPGGKKAAGPPAGPGTNAPKPID
jgi:hypothetical protein